MGSTLIIPPLFISIHALREEGDRRTASSTTPLPAFLSTPSARRATQMGFREPDRPPISIHALREEGDAAGAADRADAQ